MADTDTTEADPPAGTEDRLDRLETDVSEVKGDIKQILAKLLPGNHAEAEHRTEEHLDRGSSLEDRVRAELARARKEDQDKTAADREKADAESMKERLARLEETPPAPPRSRRTALLGWGDGRK